MSNPYGAYKKTAIATANRGALLIMLYEAAVQNIRKAILAIENKDVAKKGVAIGKAHDIINELSNTLDFEVGGNIATDLERLYHYMTEQLVKANLENSKEPLENVKKLMETLLAAWKQAVSQVNNNDLIK